MSAPSSVCLVCGRTFEKAAGDQFDQCPACLSQMKDRYSSPQESAPPSARRWRNYLWALVPVALLVIAVQYPRVKAAMDILFPPAPESVPSTADPKAQCLSNLWHISSLIQQNRWPSEAMVCPLTKRPYLTKTEAGNILVSCPNPKEHHVQGLSVSRTAPTPKEIP